jgi:hypothetical protein
MMSVMVYPMRLKEELLWVMMVVVKVKDDEVLNIPLLKGLYGSILILSVYLNLIVMYDRHYTLP